MTHILIKLSADVVIIVSLTYFSKINKSKEELNVISKKKNNFKKFVLTFVESGCE